MVLIYRFALAGIMRARNDKSTKTTDKNMADATPPKIGGLWARMFSMVSNSDEQNQEDAAQLDGVAAASSEQASLEALDDTASEIVVDALPAELTVEQPAVPIEIASAAEPPVAPPVVAESPAPPFCAACGAVRLPAKSYCEDCGYMFPVDGVPAQASPAAVASSLPPSRVPVMHTPNVRIIGRYEIGELLSENQGICRYRGQD